MFLSIFLLVLYVAALSYQKRPFYNIAHMANSIVSVDYFLGKSANSVEVDVTFAGDGLPPLVYHGSPCDCFRECEHTEELPKFLTHIRQITTVGKVIYLWYRDSEVYHLNIVQGTGLWSISLNGHENFPQFPTIIIIYLSDLTSSVIQGRLYQD